jgi:putative ABC transport system permease protein
VKRFSSRSTSFADQEIFEVFSFELIMGNPETALDDVYSIIMSESMGKKYFGSEDPIGKIIDFLRDSH